MITERAIVRRCRERMVEVELQRQSACGNCELSPGCGTAALGRLLGHRGNNLQLETDSPLQPGDRIEISLPETALVRASLMVYGLPLMGMLAGALGGAGLSLAEGAIALLAAVGFAGGYLLARLLTHRLARHALIPRIKLIEVNPQTLAGS